MTSITYPVYLLDVQDKPYSHMQMVEITNAAAEIVTNLWLDSVAQYGFGNSWLTNCTPDFNAGSTFAWIKAAEIACGHKVPRWWFREFHDFARIVSWFYWAARG